jgi:plasmid stability protein
LSHLAATASSWYQRDTVDAMPNVHIRDLPPETIEALRTAARRHNRSLNAEIVAALVERARQDVQAESLLERLEEARREWREMNPDGYPPGLEPETIIRAARDAR